MRHIPADNGIGLGGAATIARFDPWLVHYHPNNGAVTTEWENMDTKELVTVEVIPHSGAVIVTALLNPYDGYGAYFKSVTYYFCTVNESIELFIDQYGDQIVRD